MRITLSTLLFLAVFVQAFIPVGFMPGTGVATMVICSGMDRKTVTVDENGQPTENHKQSDCAYTPVLATSIPLTPVFVLSQAEFTFVPVNRAVSIRAVNFYHSAQPQGPPSFA